jgi:hypothetical protein
VERKSWRHKQLQGVPLATEHGISLIILTPIKILQRNLNSSTFFSFTFLTQWGKSTSNFVAISSLVVKLLKEMPVSVVSATPCIIQISNNISFPELSLCAPFNEVTKWPHNAEVVSIQMLHTGNYRCLLRLVSMMCNRNVDRTEFRARWHNTNSGFRGISNTVSLIELRNTRWHAAITFSTVLQKLSTEYRGWVSDTEQLLQNGPAQQDLVTQNNPFGGGSCSTESSGAD